MFSVIWKYILELVVALFPSVLKYLDAKAQEPKKVIKDDSPAPIEQRKWFADKVSKHDGANAPLIRDAEDK